MSTGMSLNVPVSPSHHGPTRLGLLDWIAIAAAVGILGFLIYHHVAPHHDTVETAHVAPLAHPDAHGDTHAKPHGPPEGYSLPPIWACAPFVAILLCIALLPLIPATEHWWESNKNRLGVSLVLAALTLLYYALVQPMTYNHATMHTYSGVKSVIHILEHAVLIEYIPFIVLLFSLYVISGGISLKGDLPAHPATNAAFLGVGGLLASFIGTTGASMLLIRPLLQTNSERRYTRHTVIFFIFLVSNCGGLLLPIGDPPLFLGYLRGVEFFWTLGLVMPWLLVSALILGVYIVWDVIAYKKEKPADIKTDETRVTKLKLAGKINFLYLLGIVACVALIDPSKEFLGLGFKPFPFMRELCMMALVGLSLLTTSKKIYQDNQFNYHAILEVAALFIGIFICMQVPIEILNAKGAELGLSKPWHFFWTTGGLSAFLDNAPTYVVFFETAKVLPETGGAVVHLSETASIAEPLLVAISLGAVFMGALTYIGNGPNFMVKSIAEQGGVKMPSFFGYMKYSFGVLVPIFVVVMFLFLL
ncbi:MAG: sodium:proton antiporter [Phycisphaerae bacterium]|nr:MAG: sodium:proton antiporter [Phycisphaerae bacterium]